MCVCERTVLYVVPCGVGCVCRATLQVFIFYASHFFLNPHTSILDRGRWKVRCVTAHCTQVEVITHSNGSGHRGMDTGSGLHGAAASSSPETDEIAPPLDALAGEATSSRSGGGSGWSRSGCSARLLG